MAHNNQKLLNFHQTFIGWRWNQTFSSTFFYVCEMEKPRKINNNNKITETWAGLTTKLLHAFGDAPGSFLLHSSFARSFEFRREKGRRF